MWEYPGGILKGGLFYGEIHVTDNPPQEGHRSTHGAGGFWVPGVAVPHDRTVWRICQGTTVDESGKVMSREQLRCPVRCHEQPTIHIQGRRDRGELVGYMPKRVKKNRPYL